MTNKEAIETVRGIRNSFQEDCFNDIEALDLAIKALEERPQGEWVLDKEHSITMDFYKCTNCNYFGGNNTYSYCPRCGARMGAENEDSN